MKKLKRWIIMPIANWKRKKLLYKSFMTPEEIAKEEKACHDTMIIANRQGKKDFELEFKHKRDVLRKVLGISG